MLENFHTKILLTLVYSSIVLHEAIEVTSAFVRLMVETTRIVVSAVVFHCTLLSLGLHYEQFELYDNTHDISLGNHRKEIEIIAII